MAQQNIDFGTFPDDPSADAIRTAFNKVQNNFDQLFGANANTTVTSINRTPGAGVTVNFPTGNVVLSANLACLQVSTSSLKMGRGSNTGSNALITQSSQTLVIDIDPAYVYSNYFADVNNGLSIFNGNLSINSNYQANLTSFGNLTVLNVDGNANFIGSNTYISNVANLRIPGGGAGFTIVTDGTGNLSWSGISAGNGVPGGNATEVQFQGSGGNLGTFSGNGGFTFITGNGLLQTPLLTVAGNAIAANFIGKLANGNSNITITGNSNITFTSNNVSTMVISNTGANITGTANVSGNANVGNIGAEQGIFTTSANIPLIQNGNSNVTIGANTTVSIFVEGNATARIAATSTGANISGIANVTGSIVTAGNISTTGSNGTVQANNFNITGAATGNSNVSTVTGNLGIRAIASTYTDNVVVGGATIANSAIHAIAQPTLAAANAVVTFTNASTLYIANAPAPGTNATLTNPYALYIANGNTYFGGSDNYILGNLTVQGNATYYNVDTFTVEDPIISLGGGPNGNALTTNDGKDRGTALQYYTTAPVTAFMGWDNSNSEFAFGKNVTIASDVVTFTNLGNARGLTWLGNIDGTYANFSGNITTTGNANLGNSAVANYFIGSFYGNANTAGTVTTNAQPNITSVGTLTSLDVTGNTTSNNFIGKLSNGNSNISITAASNITLTAVGNTIMTITGTGANIAGTANVSGNANVNNLGTTRILASGNITTTQLISNIATGTAPFVVTSTTQVANLSVATAGTATSATTAGTVTTAAQSNITSVGTLTSLNVSGNISAGNISATNHTGTTANLTGQYITTVATGTAPLVVTSTTQVANLSVATAGSATTAGTVTTAAQPNITSVGTLTGLTVGNANANAVFGNGTIVLNSGLITGNGNGLSSLVGANVTGTVANATYAVSAGSATSATTAGTVTTAAQGNITSVGTLSSLGVSGAVTASTLISNVATGTAPLTVTSTTRVANLNVAYANVSDFGAITAQTTGTYYPVMISAGTSGNYAHAVGPTGISHNLATNTVTATTFTGNLSGNVTATGTVQAANITATAFITRAVTTSISANGTGPTGNTQANATALTTEINIVSAVSATTGVRLPAAVAGTVVYITNNSANSLVVYPQTNGQINNLGANIGFTQGANATLQFMAPTTTQWYTIGATYA